MSEVKWTLEQLQAINEKGSNILVAAAAGSGKTAVLVERIIHKIIEEKIDIDKMLVATFTNAAASEMRQKILEAIYKKLEEEPENEHLQRQIILLNKASICTIHSFCLEVIHNHFYEIDVPANFRIADTAEIDLLKQEVLEDLFEEKYIQNDSDFIELLDTYASYRSDNDLQELVLNIHEFIQSSPFPKKWVQSKLEEYKAEMEKEDLSKTSYGKTILEDAKEQINMSISNLEIEEKKLGSFKELAKFSQFIAEEKIDLITLKEACVSWNKAYKTINEIYNHGNWPRATKDIPEDLKALTEKSKAVRDSIKASVKDAKLTGSLINIINQPSEDILNDLKAMYPILTKLTNLVLEFGERFSQKKKEKNCVDFDDFEHLALAILLDENGNPTDVAKKYQEKFEEILIDEYQDSNLVQEAILTSVSRGNNIFMVGDVKQSIYKFRQARPELFLSKYNSYKLKEENQEETGLKIQLFKNFRSRENVLDITNFIFESIMSKELGDINYNEIEYLNYGANYIKPEEQIKNYAGTAEIDIINLKENESITAFIGDEEKQKNDEEKQENEEEHIEDDVLEAKFVANKINELLKSDYHVFDKETKQYRKIKPKDIVILLRSPSYIAPFYEKELVDLNIPVYTDKSASYLDAVEVQTILSVLKVLDNPMQDIPLAVVLRSFIGNFTDNDLITIRLTDRNCTFYEALIKSRLSTQGQLKQKIENILEKLEKWKEQESYLSLDELIWQIYLDTGYYQYVGLLPRWLYEASKLKKPF